MYDEVVDPARLMGGNKSFLERVLPHIASLMRSTIEDVVDQSEVLVIANGSPAFRRVAAMARDDQTLIDLVGLGQGPGDRTAKYQGIGW